MFNPVETTTQPTTTDVAAEVRAALPQTPLAEQALLAQANTATTTRVLKLSEALEVIGGHIDTLFIYEPNGDDVDYSLSSKQNHLNSTGTLLYGTDIGDNPNYGSILTQTGIEKLNQSLEDVGISARLALPTIPNMR